MRKTIVVLFVAVLAIGAVIGASAYTTGSVSRSTSVNVVSDDVGLIGLSDGTSGDLVTLDSSGQLSIDFTAGGASGVITDATFTLGDTADPLNKMAFNLTNNGPTARDLTIEYTGTTGAAGDGTVNIEFTFYDSTGTSVATVTDETTSATITGAASGATYTAVISIDTTGLTTSADLSGTLKVSA
ncbi:MAG: hypothetical protein ABEJ42_04595 [Halobacteriaceae archaeon]